MIKLTGRNIGVIPKFYDNKSDSGLLYIPEDSIRRANQGTVAYVGNKVQNVKIGDFVLFSGYSGTTLRIDEGIIIILNEEFITCKILEDVGEVRGLYLKSSSQDYFAAPHETVIRLLNDSRELLEVKIPPPKKEEYDAK